MFFSKRFVKLVLSKNDYTAGAPMFESSMFESSYETTTSQPSYGNGINILASYPEFAFDMMG
jgi:hypothetical protein